MSHSSKASRKRARRRELFARTLSRWRAGSTALDELASPDLRRAYEHAIALALRHLPRDTSMVAMVRHYWQESGAVDECIDCACLCGDPDGGLDPAIVRSVAFSRRLRMLVRVRR